MKNKIGRSTGKGRGGLRSAIYYILRGHCTHLHSETKKKKKNNELLRVAVDDWPSAFATAADASDSTEASPETRCFDHCYTATEESIAQCTTHEAYDGTIDRGREMENRLVVHAIAPLHYNAGRCASAKTTFAKAWLGFRMHCIHTRYYVAYAAAVLLR